MCPEEPTDKPILYDGRSSRIRRPLVSESSSGTENFMDQLKILENASELDALHAYFFAMQGVDKNYFDQIVQTATIHEQKFHETKELLATRKAHFLIPAYREDIEQMLEKLGDEMDQDPNKSFGVSFVLNYQVPYYKDSSNRRPDDGNEFEKARKMMTQIDNFLESKPEFKGRIDYMFYAKSRSFDASAVGLARKFGEDVIMYERMQALKSNTPEIKKPMALGLMDADIAGFEEGTLNEIMNLLPENESDPLSVIRVQGEFEESDYRNNPSLFALKLFEQAVSEVGNKTRMIPFNWGRLSLIPIVPYILSGGAFAGHLIFPDEDIRKGIQTQWMFPNVKTIEVTKKFITSGRRETLTMDQLKGLTEDKGDYFSLEHIGIGALIRMYQHWSKSNIRTTEQNGINGQDQFKDIETFEKQCPPKLLELMANAIYRFTLTSMYAVDELSNMENPPQEIEELKQGFLERRIPFFEVQLRTMDFIRNTVVENGDRFQHLKPVFEKIDKNARESMETILSKLGITFTIQTEEPFYSVCSPIEVQNLENEILADRSLLFNGLRGESTHQQQIDELELKKRFIIEPNQTEFYNNCRKSLGEVN